MGHFYQRIEGVVLGCLGSGRTHMVNSKKGRIPKGLVRTTWEVFIFFLE